MSDDSQTNTIQNRSEIVFVYDAVNCNPNGNPIDPNGAPRIDEETDVCYVTDVRLKRYIRDEYERRDEKIYVTGARTDEDESMSRERMLKRLFDLDEEADDKEVLTGELHNKLLNAIDVRYFGALLSIDQNVRDQTDLPAGIKGAVQVDIGRTLHPVQENYETSSLTSVIGTKEGKEQGGYDLDDSRIKYGLIAFGAGVNPAAAETTGLSDDDVRQLDGVTWAAIKNQTLSRSKIGQQPRFYLRVEYTDPDFDIGGLDRDLDTVESNDEAKTMRSIRDVTVDASELLRRLRLHKNRIKTLHVAVDDLIRFSTDGTRDEEDENGEMGEEDDNGSEEILHGDEFVDVLEPIAPVNPIDVPGSIAGKE